MINARVEGANELAAGLAAASSGAPLDLAGAMQSSLLLIEVEARSNLTPGHGRDTGRLQGSITHRVSGSGAELVGEVGPSEQYGLFVHVGRRPGKMPPVRALEPWARRHGMNAFLVARAIARRGIPPNPYLTNALEKSRTRIDAFFAAVGAKVVARVEQ